MRSSIVTGFAVNTFASVVMLAMGAVSAGCGGADPQSAESADSDLTAGPLSKRLTTVDCDHGAAIVTYEDYVLATGEVAVRGFVTWEVFDANIVNYLRDHVLTFDNVGADLPAGYVTNVGSFSFGIINVPTAPYRFYAHGQTRGDGSGLEEGTTFRRAEGRACGTGCAGKIEVTPGYYAHLEGAGMKLSFFRTDNRDFGVSGRYLGDWYFQSCTAPVVVP